MEHPTVLVFVEFPNPEFPMSGLLNNLVYSDAELVGFYRLDDEDSVQEVQAEYEEEFTEELQKQAELFEQHGVRTEYELIFDHDRVETRQRVARRDDVDAVLLPEGANTLRKILIGCRHTREEKVAKLLNIVDRDHLDWLAEKSAVGMLHVPSVFSTMFLADPEGFNRDQPSIFCI